MANPITLYMGSIWKYQEDGAKRIIDAVNKKHPGAKIVFEETGNWFKVVCPDSDLRGVQTTIRAMHETMEKEIRDPSGANPWLIAPEPGDLVYNKPGSPEGKARSAMDRQCPSSFDKYKATKVWSRVKDKTPETITVHSIVGAKEKNSILERTGVHLAFDVPDRVVFMGGPSRESLDRATNMLNNMFDVFLFELPQPRHVLYAETEGPFTVDARYAAHINMGMLTSTICDPSLFPDEFLDHVYRSIFSKAACLRICLYDHFTRTDVSFFGPKAKPVFHDQARRWPLWFHKAEYAPKVLGVTMPKNETLATVPSTKKAPVASQDAKAMENNNADQPADEALGVNRGRPAASPGTSNATPSSSPSPVRALTPPTPTTPAMLPLLAGDGKHGYQLKMLLDFVNTANKNAAQNTAQKQQHNGVPGTNGNHDKGEENLVHTGDITAADLLIAIDEPPRSTAPKKTPVSSVAPTMTTQALIRRTAFQVYLLRCLGKVVGDLPYRRGRITMQAEIGRIYIMDATPEGLAYNLPGEPSKGWTQAQIMKRLDTVCVSKGSVVFTKALSIFANDIETMIGSGAEPFPEATKAKATSSEDPSVPMGNLLGDGDFMGEEDSSPKWTFHSKRVLYELRCQRFFVTNTGASKPQPEFVIVIDGTEAGNFKYSIQGIDDKRPPVWIHCIRRHWDTRILVSYNETDKLEEEYGDFARELLQSMIVPPGPMTSPKFQTSFDHKFRIKDDQKYAMRVKAGRVRNVGRFVSEDGESYLDVSWNRHMHLDYKPDNRSGKVFTIVRATPEVEDPSRGLYTSWYEVSVVSARAEDVFRENESLPPGDKAGWGRNRAELEGIFTAMYEPALQMVQKMDGVGVLVDNGLAETLPTPVRRMHTNLLGRMTAGDINRFW